MKPEEKKVHVFTLVFVLLTLVLATIANRLTSTVTIQGEETREKLVERLCGPLEALAIVRARSFDQDFQWLIIDGETTPQISKYIDENVGNSFRSMAEALERDSNLAWIVRYKGEEYHHNWKDSYSVDEGALNFTIRKTNGTINYKGVVQPGLSFTRTRSILVNPSLVPEEHLQRYGSEYLYSLALPDTFSIEYFIPKTIQPNDGIIVENAAEVSDRAHNFCLIAGALVMLLYVVLVPYRYEEDFELLRRIRRLKFLLAAIVLCTSTFFMLNWAYQMSMSHADGSLIALFESFSMTPNQSRITSYLAVTGVWMVLYALIGLLILYIRCELKRGEAFIYEDSLLYWTLQKVKNRAVHLFSASNRLTPEFKIFIVACSYVFCATLLLCAGAIFFELPGLLISALLAILFGVAVVYLWGKSMVKDYRTVHQASHQLALGRFSEITPDQVGIYQPLYDELLHISDSYENALKEGLSSQVSKAQLISNVSHDLKTPVAGIQSYSELITMSDNMEDIHHYAKELTSYSARLNALIVDLFDITKATSGDIVLNPVQIDLRELVEQVDGEWQDRLSGHELSSVKTLSTPVMITLDPDKMVRVMDNLYSNVLKYAMPHTRVFVTLEKRSEYCELRIRNTSKTILDFDPERIMDRFVRGDASRTETGSGLGLAIVKSFVEIQGGRFEIECDGDLFTARIRFPITSIDDLPIEHPEDIEQDDSQTAAASHQPDDSVPAHANAVNSSGIRTRQSMAVSQSVSQMLESTKPKDPGAALLLPREGTHAPLPDLPALQAEDSLPVSAQRTGSDGKSSQQTNPKPDAEGSKVEAPVEDVLLAASMVSLQKEKEDAATARTDDANSAGLADAAADRTEENFQNKEDSVSAMPASSGYGDALDPLDDPLLAASIESLRRDPIHANQAPACSSESGEDGGQCAGSGSF